MKTIHTQHSICTLMFWLEAISKSWGLFDSGDVLNLRLTIINVENHTFSHKVIVFIWNRRYTIRSHDYRSMHRCQGGRIYARLHGIRDAEWMQRHHQPTYTPNTSCVMPNAIKCIAAHDCVHICYLSSVLFIVIVARLIVWVPANIFWGGVGTWWISRAIHFSPLNFRLRSHNSANIIFQFQAFNTRFKTTLQQLDGGGLTFG